MLTLPQSVLNIINTLKQSGFIAHAVGGSVRDLIMGKPTKGWDFTTDAVPEEIVKLFPDSFYDNVFGTVGVKIYQEPKIKNQEPNIEDIYEITTYRSEQGYTDHRHPDKIIWGKTLEEDLSRRDFTINAIASDGTEVIDPFSGLQDIKAKIIRAVGDPGSRFAEDALRMMRAVRIASQLGFLIEPDTLFAIQNNSTSLNQISQERIYAELIKILASSFPADGILLLKNSRLLPLILPELDACFSISQKSPQRHHVYDVGTHSVMALKHCPNSDPIVRLATLLHDIGKSKTVAKNDVGITTFYNHEIVGAKMVKEISRRLRLSRRDADKLWHLVRFHQFTVDERQTDSALRRFVRNVTPEYLDDMLALRIGDRLGGGARETSWRLELYKKRLIEVQKIPFTVAALKIDGHDVMGEFGIPPGPQIGKILNLIFNEVESGQLPNEREPLLKRLTELKTL